MRSSYRVQFMTYFIRTSHCVFGPEDVPKRYFSSCSLKMPKAFFISSAAQQNFAYIFLLIFPTDLPSQIFKLIRN